MSSERRNLRRVGHKGADLIEPGNTLESFNAAIAHGVDMIEFDVLPERGTGRLILAHDHRDGRSRQALTLEEGLAHFATDAFDEIELDVDLKLPGYELRVVEALRSFGLLTRSLISTFYPRSLALIRAAEPTVPLGWSVPRARRDYIRNPFLALPALGILNVLKRGLPGRAARAIRAGRCEAIMAHWRLVTEELVSSVTGAGGALYVWTVDEPERIRALEALGVTGIITNDPRLFGAPA